MWSMSNLCRIYVESVSETCTAQLKRWSCVVTAPTIISCSHRFNDRRTRSTVSIAELTGCYGNGNANGISYRNVPLPCHHEADCEGSAPTGRQPGHKQSHAQLDSLCLQRRQYLLQGSDKLAHDEGEASSPLQSHSHRLLPTIGRRGCLLIGLDEARLVDMQLICQLTRDKSTATPRS